MIDYGLMHTIIPVPIITNTEMTFFIRSSLNIKGTLCCYIEPQIPGLPSKFASILGLYKSIDLYRPALYPFITVRTTGEMDY